MYVAIGSSPNAMLAMGFDSWPSATDAYGLSALPAGNCYYGNFGGVGSNAFFWNASEDGNRYALGWYTDVDRNEANFTSFAKYYGLSVRCVKD